MSVPVHVLLRPVVLDGSGNDDLDDARSVAADALGVRLERFGRLLERVAAGPVMGDQSKVRRRVEVLKRTGA